jgi:hypothetical protein
MGASLGQEKSGKGVSQEKVSGTYFDSKWFLTPLSPSWSYFDAGFELFQG